MSIKNALVLTLVASLGAAHVANATAEICGNGIDDDGNGVVDDNCAPTLTTGVCESPLSCGDTGMVSWKTGAIHYDLPPDIAPKVPFGPSIGLRRFFTGSYAPPSGGYTNISVQPLGPQWQHTYMTWIVPGAASQLILHTSDGRDVLFTASGSPVGGWQYYTAQAGYHVLQLKQNTVSPFQVQEQLLSGDTVTFNSLGQLTTITDIYGQNATVTWSAKAVATVTDAAGTHRLLFGYTSNLLTTIKYQFYNGSAWTTNHTTTLAYTSGVLMSATVGSQLAQQYSYTGGFLTAVKDGASNQMASFAYSSTVSGQVNRVDTPRGSVAFDFSASRTACSGQTALYFNKGDTAGNITSCTTDSDCGSDAMCGGKTGGTGTGVCYQAGRCLTLGTQNGESVVTTVQPFSQSTSVPCSGACTDALAYVWSSSTSLLNVIGKEDPLENYISSSYNSDGLPTQITYGDNDDNPVTLPTGARTVFIAYDTTYRGRIASVTRASDLNTSGCSSSAGGAGCAQTVYGYDASSPFELQTIKNTGTTYDITGSNSAYTYTTTYHHDSDGRITEIDGPLSGAKTTYDFWPTSTDPKSGYLEDVYQYTSATSSLHQAIFGYDFFGNPTGTKDPSGNVTCQTFDTSRNFLTQRRIAMAGQADCTTVNGADLTTNWLRDSALRLTELQRPDGSCVLDSYDTIGRLNQVKRRDDCNGASAGDYQQYLYASDNLVKEIDTYNASGTITRTQPYTYYDSRRLQEIVNPVNTTYYTGLVYDIGGMLTEVDGANGLSKVIDSINNDRRVASEKHYKDASTFDTWTFAYAWTGDQKDVTDGNAKATPSVRDDLGRIVELQSTDFSYPKLRLYDAASNEISMTDGLGLYSSPTYNTIYYTYDYVGRLLTTADYQNQCSGTSPPEIQRTFDAMPTGITCPITGGCNNIIGRQSYEKTSLMCSSVYTDQSLDQETFYSYDAAGRLVEEYIRDDSGRVADHKYSYTKNGALSQMTTPSGAVIGWTYGSAGSNSDTDLVTAMWRTTTATPVIDTVLWNSFGPLQQYNQENSNSGIAERTRITRNLAYRISGLYVEQQTGGVTLQSVATTEDAKGRVTTRDYYPNSSGVQDSYFFYDEQDRVICESTTSTTCSPSVPSTIKNYHSLSPPFTAAGDWLQILRPISGSTGVTNVFNESSTSHQLQSVNQNDGTPTFGATYFNYLTMGDRQSDDNSDTMSYDGRYYSYDALHNLTLIIGDYYNGSAWKAYDASSAFDGHGRRVTKLFANQDGTGAVAQWFFYYDPMNRLTEVRYTPNTSVPATYSVFQLFWLHDRLVAYWETDYPSVTTSKRYVGTDESGRPVDMLSWPSSGSSARVWSINPRAWGMDTNGVGPTVFQPILFAGQYQDEETAAYENDGATIHRPGLALNGYRTYDPFTGSYLQVDPLVEETWSSYVYAGSNPVGDIDPHGDTFCEESWAPNCPVKHTEDQGGYIILPDIDSGANPATGGDPVPDTGNVPSGGAIRPKCTLQQIQTGRCIQQF